MTATITADTKKINYKSDFDFIARLNVADAADYVVIRYSTPRISDDNKSVTISVYELKFGLLNSGDTEYTYASKAIHKTIS